MTAPGDKVTARTKAAVLGEDRLVREEPIALHYDPADPLAVELTFECEARVVDGEAPTWTFARDLLADGLDDAAGVGDVRVFSRKNRLNIRFTSPDGTVLVELSKAFVALFVRRAYRSVPRGEEIADAAVSAAIGVLLRGTTR